MAGYNENTAGIIGAINACITAAGGTLTSYPANTGGIISALVALEAAISGGSSGGGGASLTLPLTAGEDVTKSDALYMNSDGSVYKAKSDGTREEATVIGLAKEDALAAATVDVVARGKIVSTGTPYVAGTDMYLDATAGGLTSTIPTSGFIVSIGEGLSTTDLDVRIQTPIELT